MRPQLLKISSGPSVSFGARMDDQPYLNNNWHYHPEIELIHVIKGEGTLFAGDTSIRFTEGDLILLGSQLPHYWRFDEVYTQDNPLPSLIELTQFCDDFWGGDFLKIPENKGIVKLLDRARKGMVLSGKNAAISKTLLSKMIKSTGANKIALLIQLLNTLSKEANPNYISSTHYFDINSSDSDRINAIYNYTLSHFKKKIYLKEVAALANLSINSFCRYFKARTKKNYSALVTELRVGYACKLLAEKNLSIKEICFNSGFNTFTNFNKQFKALKGMQPNEFRKRMDLE